MESPDVEPGVAEDEGRRTATMRLALFAVVFLVFAPSLFFPFLAWDDRSYVTENPWIQNLTWERFILPFRAFYLSAWTPLPMVVTLLEFHAFGVNPAPYRVINILLHCVAVLGVFELVRSFGARGWAAWLLAAAFGCHPLRIESVVWISELKDVMCSAFYVWGLVMWRRSSRRDLVAACVLCVGALLSKPMAVSFGVVAILHDALLLRDRMRGRAPLYLILIVLCAAVSLINMRAQAGAIEAASPWFERILTALYSPWHHIRRTIVPLGISPAYPREVTPVARLIPAATGIVILVILSALTFRLLRSRRSEAAFGLLAAGAALAPVSGIIPFSSVWAADRFSYLPTVFVLCSVAVLMRERRVAGRGAWVAALAVFAGVHVISTFALMRPWRSDVALWTRVIDLYPDSRLPKVRLYLALEEEGLELPEDLRGGIEESGDYRASLAVEQGDADALALLESRVPDAGTLVNLMAAYRNAGDRARAVGAAHRLLALEAPVRTERVASAAETLAWAGEDSEARKALERVGEPTWAGARALGLLAKSSHAGGRNTEALDCAMRALDWIPVTRDALLVMGRLGAEGAREARGYLQTAALHPSAGREERTAAFAFLGRMAIAAGNERDAAAFLVRAFPMSEMEEWSAKELEFAGFVAEEAGQFQTAERCYAMALVRDARLETATQNLAILCAVDGRFEEAEELLVRAAEWWPENESLHVNLARVRENRKRAEGAEDE